jgi:23S rRNA pseudouridine1911/1915/1917 synthase
MLHAAELGFVHPADEREMLFEEPPPPDFEQTLARLRRPHA